MKKTLVLTAGIAAFGFAALPVFGVFAETSTSTVTDEIQVTIPSSCAITSKTTDTSDGIGDGTRTENKYTATMQNGELKSDIGGTDSTTGTAGANVISVTCNDTSGSGSGPTWKLTAIGGDGTTVSTEMTGANGGTSIATGTATSGATSSWAMKVAPGDGVTIQNGYDSFKAVPGTAAVISEGSGAAANAFTMTYQVYVGTDQEADTYTGHVTYTLTSPSA